MSGVLVMRNRDKSGQPAGILICGNANFFDAGTLNRLTDYYNVVIAGVDDSSELYGKRTAFGSKSHKINLYKDDITSENFHKIMKSYLPDVVWYISGFVDGNTGLDNERKKIEKLVYSCAENEVSKIIFVSSIESSHQSLHITSETFNCAQTEEQVKFLSHENNVKTVILRAPHILKHVPVNTWLGSLFDRLINDEPIEFQYDPEDHVEFMSLRNLTDLLISMTEETMDTGGEYSALNGCEHTYRELGDVLKECVETAQISYKDSRFHDLLLNRKKEAMRLKKDYGFIPGDDFTEGIKYAFQRYSALKLRKPGKLDRARTFLNGISDKVLKVTELVGLFLLIQFLIRYTTDNIYFRYIDLRLFYVVIMGSVHGMFIGILSGFIQCISLAVSFIRSGVTGSMLFYNTDYWLPFAIYLMTGAISGYMVTSKDQKLKFAEEEVETIQGKYDFLNNVYMSVIDNKEEYKRQILGYQDSFGKIFEAVENLNSSTPAEIFMNGVEILENILKNHSIAIYTIDDSQNYARLVACSRGMTEELSRSLSLDAYRDVYDVIVQRDTWKNISFSEDKPQYAYGIVEDEKLKLMICIYEADTEQMGQYYMNLFTIMCHLVRISLIRALEYQKAIEKEKYRTGTEILVPSYFEKELEAQRRMIDAGVASFILLELETADIDKTFVKLEKLIRHSDMVGEGEDGKCYLLLTQINRKIFETIGERLRSNDIGYRILEGI